MLDDKLIEGFSVDNFVNQYKAYKVNKTDIYTGKIKIQMGVDGVDYKDFEKNLDKFAEHTCKRVIKGRYFFSPFREHEVPKPPFTSLKEAKKHENKTRTLSIATIKDVVFQKIFYNVIEDYCEERFNEIKAEVSFAYRRGKSAPEAARKIYSAVKKEGFEYALDGDIQKFFDKIPHDLLYKKIQHFFGPRNKLVILYLKRFFSVDRVLFNDYDGNIKKFFTEKPKRTLRKEGIPQGGVLSGLVANIFMHDFDKYMVEIMYPKYEDQIKYFRYADDCAPRRRRSAAIAA
jgi:RNA-directed DNA polymerase